MQPEKLRLLVGVSGGIAAYKVPSLIRLMKKYDVAVKVVITASARSLVGEETLRTVSGNPVYSDSAVSAYDMDHIRLAEWADLFLICPATANTMAKIARGMADNLLTTLALSFSGPLFLAPAMNPVMWQNPATGDAIACLKKRGVRILPVTNGPLACGDEGPGRMLGIETIAEYILGSNVPRCLEGKKILIASGPTAEPIDPVRVITNRSSGRMGAALASAALCAGADVTVVSGPAQAALPEGITVERVTTAGEMAEALRQRFDHCDICVMAAAISDFRPQQVATEKIKRSGSGPVTLVLEPTEDVAALLARRKNKQYLVCFALETDSSGQGEEQALAKMQAKKCDMIVFNTVESSLDTENATISIIAAGKSSQRKQPMSKREAAREIVITIAREVGLFNG
jgi:phosphopantothenoylcysteine decarboxylase/phosphopantothenate--cysteine ligase